MGSTLVLLYRGTGCQGGLALGRGHRAAAGLSLPSFGGTHLQRLLQRAGVRPEGTVGQGHAEGSSRSWCPTMLLEPGGPSYCPVGRCQSPRALAEGLLAPVLGSVGGLACPPIVLGPILCPTSSFPHS